MPHTGHHRADAKTRGGTDPLSLAVANRDASVLHMVKEAIAHKQVLLAYQPVMRSDNPSKTAFYEGLIRVLDETGRVIPAHEFIGVAEESEIGRQLDVLALEHGLRALFRTPSLRLSINMSARSFGYRRWMSTLNRWLKRDETLGERLILEVTESSAMTVPEIAIDFMEALQCKGVCFAMDDFGAGHTALRYFRDFQFDIVKIDGQFIRGISNSPDNRALVSAMISIARHFEMLVVAEFVEDEKDAQVLIDLGIDCMHGYHYGAPTTRPDWLRQDRQRASA